jgi:hypothetical protein
VPEPADTASPAAGAARGHALRRPEGSYLIACGWTPPTVPGPPRQNGEGGGTPQAADVFLAAITAELEARGLEVRQSQRQGILAEISVSSPEHCDRGAVSIGYDGFMVWERWTPAADSDRAAGIVRLIAWILAGDAVTAGSAQ